MGQLSLCSQVLLLPLGVRSQKTRGGAPVLSKIAAKFQLKFLSKSLNHNAQHLFPIGVTSDPSKPQPSVPIVNRNRVAGHLYD